MYTRHVEGRPKIINKIIALSKCHLPPCTPRHIWLQLIYRGAGWAPLALGSLCPPGFAPHYVAVQPGRCRRFIGTLLARIKYAPCTLRMEQRTPRSESLAADLENKIAILRERISRSILWKDCHESFQDFDFLRFAIFEF